MTNKNIIIFGATSTIAQEAAKIFAASHHRLFLIGRNEQHLSAIANDLKLRGAQKVDYECCDLIKLEYHPQLIENAIKSLGHADIVLIAHGTLPNQKQCENNFSDTYSELKTNLISSMSLLTILANYFEKRKAGCIAVISSVAGDRGRQSNYVYGAAKAGLNVFLQGLRNRLHHANVQVVTIKPGFVDTAMTQHFKKGLLWARPEKVAKNIVKAIYKNSSDVYTPGFWRYIMLGIRLIPEAVFCRLRL